MPKRGTAMPGLRTKSALVAKEWTHWHEDAACAGESSLLFYGRDTETAVERHARERAALAVCERCPVRSPCREHATNLPEPYGVWGGTTEAHRKSTRRLSTECLCDTGGRAS